MAHRTQKNVYLLDHQFIVCVCVCMQAVRTQLCPTLHDPMDCGLPGSSGHGIFQARMLECVASSFSRESSQPRDRTLCLFHVLRWQAGSLPGEPPGKPHRFIIKGSNSGSARWKRCIQQHTGKGPWSSQALQVCRSPQICMCSPTWKLSEPPPFRFLRRLHCKGTVD